jgi:PAS domain S-box-containing protein
VDAERRYRFCNRAYSEWFGLPESQIIGKTMEEVLGERAWKGFRPYMERALQGQRVDFEIEAHYRRGGPRWVRGIYTPHRDEQGEVLGVIVLVTDVSERKRWEETLRESEERYRTFIARSTEGVWRAELTPPIDLSLPVEEQVELAYRNGHVAECNDAMARMYGLRSAQDLIGRTLDFMLPAASPEAREYVASSARAGYRIDEMESVERDAQGNTVYFTNTMAGIIEDGRLVRVWGTQRDITQRKLAERRLIESEEKFSVVFQKAPLAAALTKLKDGTFVDVNEAFERLFGFAKEEVLGKNSVEVGMLQDSEVRTKMRADLHGQGSVHEREIRLRTKSGKECFVLVSADVVEFGGEKYAIGTSQDITERKRAEEALRESEERFRQLAENIPQLAWMTDANGEIIWYNKRWFEYTGTTAEEMQAGARQAVHHPEHIEGVLAKFKQALVSGQPWEDTFPLRSRDGAYRWFLSRAFPIRDASGRISRWFGTNTDITELREAQENLKQARVDLEEHAARLEEAVAERTARLRETVGELEAFSYSLAHDMRAPLRAMQGFAKILGEEYGDQIGVGKEYLRRISASANRLDALILDVLNYSKIVRSDLPLQPIETKKFVREIIESYPNLHGPAASIRLEGPMPAVLANPAALTQVVSNLLGNAVKFVDPGVKPKVQVRASREADHMIRIWFEDNGIGIPMEVQARMFMMFQRLNPPEQYEGTGIGLTIVRKAVERMGGKVGVESEPGKGSRFWIELKEPT